METTNYEQAVDSASAGRYERPFSIISRAGYMYSHQSVMLDAAVDALMVRADGAYLDGTFGRGGHARALLKRLAPAGRLIAIDKDPSAIECAAQLASEDPRLAFWHGGFADLGRALKELSIRPASLSGILLDLGVSSPQLDDPGRGFSFRGDGPLDMRMNPGVGETAADWLNRATAEEIADVLWQFGEERRSRRIARAIVARRPLSRTAELGELIAAVLPTKPQQKHPATRSFQAIRIHINNELGELDQALASSLDWLAPGGRLVVISFHSLEDRRVKHFVRQHSQQTGNRRLPVAPQPLLLKRIGGAVKPDPSESESNPRSRSAVMRVAERTEAIG